MNNTLEIILYSSAAGFPIFLGALISHFFKIKNQKIKNEFLRWIMAFSGGVLLSAISFALLPKGIELLDLTTISILFICGTILYMSIDIFCDKIGGSFAQIISMMSDFLPEALALGASFAHDHTFGLFVAIFIGIQNLPEAFNSYIELRNFLNGTKTLLIMFMLSFTGIIAALTGELLLGNSPKLIAGILSFSAGGILYLIFHDIAPLSHKKRDWVPATGASFGYLLGIIADKLVN